MRVRKYVYVCMHAHVCVYVYVCVYVHACVYVYSYVYSYVYAYICVYAYVYACTMLTQGGLPVRLARQNGYTGIVSACLFVMIDYL